ncbi:terminase family protein [bacterium]|nr:terminase family protein [bacterium]
MSEGEINLELFKKQLVALNTPATEVLYGGAAGGGKSHLMRIAAITWCTAIGGLQVYLFRRLRDDLIKTHLDSPKGFRNLLAPWVKKGWVKIKEDVITFWNGSRIYLCHCQHETDVGKYLSTEIHCLLIDELTTFSENMYRQLRARVRMVGVQVPKEYEGQFPRIMCGSNPGNVGHLFVKSTFVDDAEPLDIVQAPSEEGGMKRQYIPARVNDNPALLEEDPTYVDKLKGIGSEALVRAMMNGDWNIVEGAFFDCWDESRHVVKPFQIPEHWMRFVSGDWGSAKPFSFGWWAVVSDDYILPDGRVMPRGALVRYKEWYGSKNHNDVGLKLDAEVVGGGDASRGIMGLNERCAGENLSYSVLDPAAFSNHGGPSIAERIYKAGGPFFIRADNKRIAKKGAIGGWDVMRGRLVGNEDGNAEMFVFSTCVDTIRTLPAMQHDQNNPEDLLTTGEDHIVDEIRYACMSRPFVIGSPSVHTNDLQRPSFNDMMRINANKSRTNQGYI